MRAPGLNERLIELDEEMKNLEHEIEVGIEPHPHLHPNLAKVYRAKVETLHKTLSQPKTKTEAITLLQELIERVTVKVDGKGHTIELTGDILNLINLPKHGDVPSVFEGSVKMVAGVGFEPTTFRL